jgi:mono/diheme cytochrome c family protein
MKKLHRTYAITSLLFLIILAISPFKNYFSKWRAVQNDYNRVVEKLPQKVKPAPMALQQIWARELDRIDRCTTCHLGVYDSKLATGPEPFRAHPKIHHDLDKFGCTICHQGQGLATDYADAHLPSEFWDQPVLPNRYLESSCGRCHNGEELASTPTLNHGRELINEFGCAACHNLPNFKKSFAPALEGVGSKVGRGWLTRWLKNPPGFDPQTKMPNFQLSEDEAQVLADFLMSFKNFSNDARLDSLPTIYAQKKNDDAFINLGKTRFREARCISCHQVEGRGGHLAPELAKIASKASAAWIFNYIKNPKRLQPHVEMPQYGFTDEEIAAITAYVESEFVDWEAPQADSTAHQPAANFYERGLAIFNKYNCGGCHQLASAKVTPNPAPDLSVIGSKKIYEIDFTATAIPHTVYDYIDEKIKSPRSFGENTRMPVYALNATERESITAALLAQRAEPLPMKFVRKNPAPPEYTPQGHAGGIIRKYSCLKCHTINGTGGDIAPDLSMVGSQLQRDWTKQYFKVPYSLRPIVEERMPNLFISDADIETVLDYFYTVLVNDSISTISNWDFSPTAKERGRGLFWEKYGCQSCHLVGGKGGYVGPPLDKAGDRLQPQWAFHWLMNPQRYKPKTIEPRSGVSEAEARDIVAYLMSLK